MLVIFIFRLEFWLIFLWYIWDRLTWRLLRLRHVYGSCLRNLNLELLASVRQCLLRAFCRRFFSFFLCHLFHTSISSFHTGELLIKIPSYSRFQLISNLHRIAKFRLPISGRFSLFRVWSFFFFIEGIWFIYRILFTSLLCLISTDDNILFIVSDVLRP